MSALKQKLTDLLAGRVKASTVIGTGYKNGRKSASEYLRTQLANSTLSEKTKVSTVIVNSQGRGFKTEAAAKRSKGYTQLFNGTADIFVNKTITDYGVWPSVLGDGYEIYVCAK